MAPMRWSIVTACVVPTVVILVIMLEEGLSFSTRRGTGIEWGCGVWELLRSKNGSPTFSSAQVQALLAASNASRESLSSGAASYTAEEAVALMHPHWEGSSRKREAEYEIEPDEDLDKRVRALMDAWSIAYQLDNSFSDELADLSEALPKPPHLDDCKDLENVNRFNDARQADGSLPVWSYWSGEMDYRLNRTGEAEWIEYGEELMGLRPSILGPFPPWIVGADEDNMLMTRRMQRDLWLHQHPKDCSDPSVKFVFLDFLDFHNGHSIGLGAQIHAVEGVMGDAIADGRILVLGHFTRAEHEGCRGEDYKRWSCYFAAETSSECYARAVQLSSDPEARRNGTITFMDDYSSSLWENSAKYSMIWGKAWLHQAPTIDISSELLTYSRDDHRRFWRTQATRYLMRYPSQYLCRLINQQRHEWFGYKAAKDIIMDAGDRSIEASLTSVLAATVWSRRRSYLMNPTIAMHVRQGDKAGEMHIVDLAAYMKLVEQVRLHHPNVRTILLSTEMESIITEAKNFSRWNVLYTNVPRQQGTEAMKDYEKRIGLELSSTNAFVNLLLSSEADYFVLTMGSTWSLLIDNLRSTNGRLRRGVLSVNRDRRWY